MKRISAFMFLPSGFSSRAMLILGVLLALNQPLSVSAVDLSLEEIYTILGVMPDEAASKELKKIYKKYSKLKRHKALAIAMSSGGSSIGYSYKALSELGASRSAMAKCKEWQTDHNLGGRCEILLLGEQLILPGRVLRQDVSPKTPAMAWRLEGPNGPLYLIGTVHFLKPSLMPMPAVFDHILTEADNVAFETNPILMSDPVRVSELQAIMRANPKEQKKLYDKSTKKVLKKYAKYNGFPASTAYASPIVINALQIPQLKIAALGYAFNTGVEMHYAREASKLGKRIIELEDPTTAMAPLLALTTETQLLMLRETILGLDATAPFLESLITSWLTGDAETLYTESFRDIASDDKFKFLAAQLLDDRNQHWMDKIETLIAAPETSVIMVGSAHIGGRKGLLALLKQRGFESVQLTWSGDDVEAVEAVQ
ncbi:MAG: hypothetical protein ACI9CE_001874 [Flavobacterium sp.]|jgi:uncharacterized protein YbaP (TraB family)